MQSGQVEHWRAEKHDDFATIDGAEPKDTKSVKQALAARRNKHHFARRIATLLALFANV
jgi:hypothetical protein